MSDVLDRIDASLEEVEERLLNEFNRCRTHQQSGFCMLDEGAKGTLGKAARRLHDQLENSGDRKRLELRTERHEVLQARIGVVRQLLDQEIPVRCLHEAHRQIEDSRQRLEKRVAARRKKLETEDQRDSTGVMKGLFGRPAGETELGRNRIRVTDEEERELQDIDVYLDNGIYSASRELAMVSNLAQHGAPDEPPEQGRGRAVFEARELSTTTPSVKTRARPEKEERPGAEPQKEEKRDIAQTPEEIRRKLEARKYQSSGKASFLPKDIEPADPQAFHGREPDEDKDQAGNDDKGKDEKPGSGKAAFDARELTRSPWKKDE